VYQLGALAYWLFCEATPFTDAANLPEAIKMGDLISPVVAGELPAAAADVLTTAMAPNPENRYDDVGAFYSAFCKSF
jgi:spore coat protein CotF